MRPHLLAISLAFAGCLGCQLFEPHPKQPKTEWADGPVSVKSERDRSSAPVSVKSERDRSSAPVEPIVRVQATATPPRAMMAEVATETAEPTDDALSRASDCMERGDEAGAIRHLRLHLKSYPEQVMLRMYLAELLFKNGQMADAQQHYEKFVAGAQQTTGPAKKQLMHAHTRLMAIAQIRGDDYAEHLHRGIGFVLLARQIEAGLPEPSPGFRQRVLCKAAAELGRAGKVRPEDPRTHCYLYEVWRKLDQPRSAERAQKQARQLVSSFSSITPAEQRMILD